MSNISRRIKALEEQSPGCGECGYSPGAKVTFTVSPHPAPRDFKPTYCSACGQPLSFTLTFGSRGEEVWGEGASVE